MIVAIHQPHFLPWLGYLQRMAEADLFVLLDHVQFERRNYQNRTAFRMNGESRWLTVPVLQRSQKERIVDKEVDHSDTSEKWWGPNQLATLRQAYRAARFFRDYEPGLQRLLETRWAKLVDMNQASLDFLRGAFGITTPLATSSDIAPEGARAGLILSLCRKVGATTLLAGMGGSRAYLDAEVFARHGIAIRFHDFTHPQYPQCGPQPFIPGLSAIDLLAHCGPQSRALLFGENPALERAAA